MLHPCVIARVRAIRSFEAKFARTEGKKAHTMHTHLAHNVRHLVTSTSLDEARTPQFVQKRCLSLPLGGLTVTKQRSTCSVRERTAHAGARYSCARGNHTL